MNLLRTKLSPERYKQLQKSDIPQLLVHLQHEHTNDKLFKNYCEWSRVLDIYKRTTDKRQNASQLLLQLICCATDENDPRRHIAILLQDLREFVDDLFLKPEQFLRLPTDYYNHFIGVLEILGELAIDRQLRIMRSLGAAYLFLDLFLNLYQLCNNRHRHIFRRVLELTATILAKLTESQTLKMEEPYPVKLISYNDVFTCKNYLLVHRPHFVEALFTFIELNADKDEVIMESLTHLLCNLSSGHYTTNTSYYWNYIPSVRQPIQRALTHSIRIARESNNPVTLKHVYGTIFWLIHEMEHRTNLWLIFESESCLDLIQSLMTRTLPVVHEEAEQSLLQWLSLSIGRRLMHRLPYYCRRIRDTALALKLQTDSPEVLLNIFWEASQREEYHSEGLFVLKIMLWMVTGFAKARERMIELEAETILLKAQKYFPTEFKDSIFFRQRFDHIISTITLIVALRQAPIVSKF